MLDHTDHIGYLLQYLMLELLHCCIVHIDGAGVTLQYQIMDSSQKIIWVTFQSETIGNSLYRRMADLQRNKIKLIRYTPPWAYNRSKDLEIKTRIARE